MESKTSKFLNEALKKAGFKAIRSNSIFCSSSTDNLHYFGLPYLIFPIDPFNYTWSPYVSDINLDTTSPDSQAAKFLNILMTKGKYLESDFDIFVERCNYQNTNFVDAIKSGNETMIHGSYLALDGKIYEDLILKHFTT